MILSHRHRYIFIHCRKAAGSSVKVSLYRDVGPRDVCVAAWEDAAEHGVRPNLMTLWLATRPPGLRTLVSGLARGRPGAKIVNRAAKRTADRLVGTHHGHATARDIRQRFPQEWARYYRFCIVRNSYDRVLSDYRWRTRRLSRPPTFSRYLNAIADGDDLGGIVSPYHDAWDFYTIDDRVVVDRACRYEDLAAELGSALSAAGVAWDQWLPMAKVATDRPDHRDYYTAHERQLVNRIYHKEIEEFGFAF